MVVYVVLALEDINTAFFLSIYSFSYQLVLHTSWSLALSPHELSFLYICQERHAWIGKRQVKMILKAKNKKSWTFFMLLELIKVSGDGFKCWESLSFFGFSVNPRPHKHCTNHVHFGTLDICIRKGIKMLKTYLN